MSDRLRTDSLRSVTVRSEADRDAKIEQLLLTGLDHYFAGHYEHAINVWTRVLFFDRSHPRARAYIERARSALAERQRESDELLHRGVEAFRRGESDQAQRLLQAAVDAGAPSDEAAALLDRLNRVGDGAPLPVSAPVPRDRRSPVAAPQPNDSRRGRAAAVTLVALGAVAAAAALYLSSAWERPEWRRMFAGDDREAPAAAPVAEQPALPAPRRGELALAQARALATTGRLRDALAALDRIRATDAQKPDADRLRADLQRQLIQRESAAVAVPAPPPGTPRLP